MSGKDSTEPLLTLGQMVGDDIELTYASIDITEESWDYFNKYGETESSMLVSKYGTYTSNLSLGIYPIRQGFKALYELIGTAIKSIEVVGCHYSVAYSRAISSVTLRVKLANDNDVIIGMKGFRCVKGPEIPERFHKWFNEEKDLWLCTYSNLYYQISDIESVYPVANAIRKGVLPKGMGVFEKPTVEVITMNAMGLEVRDVEIQGSKMSDADMALHYGADFPEFNKVLLDEMGEKNKGVVLLHGPPGNGKTYYIRHLVSALRGKGKRIIIVPKHVLAEMESPQFNDFMIDEFSESNTKAVFVIEDAESVLRARDSGGDGRAVVSTILNLSDGLLNDVFRVQLICTFNTALENIDEALLRKGRLLAKREFIPLQEEDAQKLIDHIGHEDKADGEMSLADIYATGSDGKNEVLTGEPSSNKKKNPPPGFHSDKWLKEHGYK